MKLHQQALINTAKSIVVVLAYASGFIAIFALGMFYPLIALSLMAIGLLSLGVWGIYKHELERLQAQERSDDRKNYFDTLLGPSKVSRVTRDTSGLVTQVLDDVRKRRQQSQSQTKE